MAINFTLEEVEELRPQITVFGVGGAGGNAVNNMITSGLTGVTFVIANTDSQALTQSKANARIQIGRAITQGLGAGARPEIGRAAAEESLPEIVEHLQGSHMCFIAAGMGGGTGTGAAPVIARAAKELDILTVGVVTKPFQFEGAHRMKLAAQGIEDLQQYVDTLIVIPNQNLFRIANERTTFSQAFQLADQVLHSGVRGVTDLMLLPGLINLDFADVRSVMSEMGKAMMGTGESEGDHRAIAAAEAAISNPLLDDVSLKGARAVLTNITGGEDLTLFDVDEATNRIRNDVDPEANIIFGAVFNDDMTGRVRVSVVATGIEGGKPLQVPTSGFADQILMPQKSAPIEVQTKRVDPGENAWPKREEVHSAPRSSVAAPYPTMPVAAAPKQQPVQHHAAPQQQQPAAHASVAKATQAADTVDDIAQTAQSASAGFIAAQKTNTSAYKSQASASPSLSAASEPAYGAQAESHAQPSSGGQGLKGFFNLMRSNKPNTQKEEPLEIETVGAGASTEKPSAAGRKDEDHFEIPAFLRRQIN